LFKDILYNVGQDFLNNLKNGHTISIDKSEMVLPDYYDEKKVKR
jgi:hypothetical protein